jgi:hypothetical protein
MGNPHGQHCLLTFVMGFFFYFTDKDPFLCGTDPIVEAGQRASLIKFDEEDAAHDLT